MNYQNIAQELVRSVRGSRSQAQVNRKLKYKTNQLYRWESGNRQISWNQFVDLCAISKIDLQKIFKVEFGFSGDMKNTADIIRYFIGQSKVSDFSKVAGFSKHVISNWLTSKSAPSLIQILQILDRSQAVLVEFLELFPSMKSHSSAFKEQSKRESLKNVLYDFPYTSAIVAVLELQSYKNLKKHVDGWIAEQIKITTEEEKIGINELLKANFISYQNEKYVLNLQNLDTRGNLKGTVRLRKHWIKRSLDVLEHSDSVTDPSRFAHFVFAVSESADKKIRQAMYEYATSLKTIVESDHDAKTIIRALSIQDIDLKQ